MLNTFTAVSKSEVTLGNEGKCSRFSVITDVAGRCLPAKLDRGLALVETMQQIGVPPSSCGGRRITPSQLKGNHSTKT